MHWVPRSESIQNPHSARPWPNYNTCQSNQHWDITTPKPRVWTEHCIPLPVWYPQSTWLRSNHHRCSTVRQWQLHPPDFPRPVPPVQPREISGGEGSGQCPAGLQGYAGLECSLAKMPGGQAAASGEDAGRGWGFSVPTWFWQLVWATLCWCGEH